MNRRTSFSSSSPFTISFCIAENSPASRSGYQQPEKERQSMTNIDHDPHFLQQKAQAQLQAALHLNAATCNHLPAEPNSNKRHSLSSQSPESPCPKRAAVSRPSSPGDQSLHGFTRIPLSSPPLNRTFSAPIPSQEINNLSSNVPAAASSSVSTRFPEETSGVNSVTVQQPIYRSCSAPIPESYLPVPASTPPRPPAAGKLVPLSPTSSFGDPPGLCPDAKRAKRMRERMIQLRKLWNEVVKEEEEDAASQDNHHCPHKDDCEASNASGTEEECDESVWVEKKGEIRVLHFKCHCNKGYQILLSGNDCYYKLNSF